MKKCKTYFIDADGLHCYRKLSNPKEFGRLHPLIIDVVKSSPAIGPNTYTIKERPFPWIPLAIAYEAKIAIKESEIRYEIDGLPLTSGSLVYTLDSKAKHRTEIHTCIDLRSKLPGGQIIMYKMWKAQDQIMRLLIP